MIGASELITVFRDCDTRFGNAPAPTAVELLAAEEGVDPDDLKRFAIAVVTELYRAEAKMFEDELAGRSVLASLGIYFFLMGRLSVKQPDPVEA